MSVTTKELLLLIEQAKMEFGATAWIDWDLRARREEGRDIVSRVTVQGAPGIGPDPMTPIHAAERLRESLAKHTRLGEHP